MSLLCEWIAYGIEAFDAATTMTTNIFPPRDAYSV